MYPTLSERHNIVVIADEAHRTQSDFVEGFTRHMRDALPNAFFIENSLGTYPSGRDLFKQKTSVEGQKAVNLLKHKNLFI